VPRVRKPRCADCGSTHARVFDTGTGNIWLCADCEWKRRYPLSVQSASPMPWEQPPAPLQRERLF